MARKTRAVVRLTENFIASVTPSQQRFEIWDEDVRGLTLRVTPTGRRSFYVLRRAHRGAMERVYLGPWPETPLRVAREKALAVLQQLVGGRSVVAERRSLRARATLGDLWSIFFEQYAKVYKRSWHTDQRRFERHLGRYAKVPLEEITPARVTLWLTEITKEAGAGAANRVRALLMTMFNVGRQRFGVQAANPVADTPRHKEVAKDRFLQPAELHSFINACWQNPCDASDWILLALLTGARAGSLNAMRWQDLNLADATWSIPAEYMKSGRAHTIPLSPLAVEILRRRRALAVSETWVFPSPGSATGHIYTPQRAFKKLLQAAGISTPTTRHDLRRTMASYGTEAGVGLAEIGRLLGHTAPGGVTSVYARVPFSTLRKAIVKIESALLRAGRDSAHKVVVFKKNA